MELSDDLPSGLEVQSIVAVDINVAFVAGALDTYLYRRVPSNGEPKFLPCGPMQTTRFKSAAGFVPSENAVVVIGGIDDDGNVLNTSDKFLLESQVWANNSPSLPMGSSGVYDAAAVQYGDSFLLIGGTA